MKRSLLSAFFALLCFRAAVGFFCPNSSEFRPSFKSRRQLSKLCSSGRLDWRPLFLGEMFEGHMGGHLPFKVSREKCICPRFFKCRPGGFRGVVVVPSSHLLLRECIKRCCHEKKNVCDPIPTICTELSNVNYCFFISMMTNIQQRSSRIQIAS